MHVYYQKYLTTLLTHFPDYINTHFTIPGFLHALYLCIWASEIWNGEFPGHRLLELVASGGNFHILAYLGTLTYATALWSGNGGKKEV